MIMVMICPFGTGDFDAVARPEATATIGTLGFCGGAAASLQSENVWMKAHGESQHAEVIPIPTGFTIIVVVVMTERHSVAWF